MAVSRAIDMCNNPSRCLIYQLGLVPEIRSCSGTSFNGTSRGLKQLYKDLDKTKILVTLLKNGI